MQRLLRWLKRNFRETPQRLRDEQASKAADVYLHESWFEHFQDDLARWKAGR